MTPEERAHELGLLRESDQLLTQRERFLLEEIDRLTATPRGTPDITKPKSALPTPRVEQLRAELAALREPMACGHPRACWREDSLTIKEIYEVEANHPPLIGQTGRQRKAEECPADCPCRKPKGHCTACARERLAVAAALDGLRKRLPENFVMPDSDRSALDAHDAGLLEKAIALMKMHVFLAIVGTEQGIVFKVAEDQIRALKTGGSK